MLDERKPEREREKEREKSGKNKDSDTCFKKNENVNIDNVGRKIRLTFVCMREREMRGEIT